MEDLNAQYEIAKTTEESLSCISSDDDSINSSYYSDYMEYNTLSESLSDSTITSNSAITSNSEITSNSAITSNSTITTHSEDANFKQDNFQKQTFIKNTERSNNKMLKSIISSRLRINDTISDATEAIFKMSDKTILEPLFSYSDSEETRDDISYAKLEGSIFIQSDKKISTSIASLPNLSSPKVNSKQEELSKFQSAPELISWKKLLKDAERDVMQNILDQKEFNLEE